MEEERRVVGAWLDLVDEVLFGGVAAGEGGRERGWERVKRKREGARDVARTRGANRRAATVEAAEPPVPPVPAAAVADRRVSAPVMRGLSLSDEPEDMYAIREEDAGEGADAWAHEETHDDEDLPTGRSASCSWVMKLVRVFFFPVALINN